MSHAVPFQDTISDGVLHAFCFTFMWHRASLADIPFCMGGFLHLKVACWGEKYRTQSLHIETPKSNIAGYEGIAEIVSGSVQG